MSDRNWEAEMAKIDKQLASVSDDQLLSDKKSVAPTKGGGGAMAAPAARATPAAQSGQGGAWRGWVKVVIAIAAAAGLMFWPWPARCGIPLVGFTAATGGVVLLGMWSAVGTWRHRLGLAHVASLLVMTWGLVLGAREVLPRTGYAMPTLERPGQWTCDGLTPLPTAPSPATSLPSATPTVPPAEQPVTPPVESPTTPPGSVDGATQPTVPPPDVFDSEWESTRFHA
jgi:hypothetical protein